MTEGMGSHFFDAANCVVRRWAVILTIAGLLLAVAALKGTYVDPHLPDRLNVALLWSALVSTVFVFAAWLVSQIGDWLSRDVTESFRAIKRSEIQHLIPFYDRVVGGDRPSLNELKEIFAANSQVFRVCEKVISRGHQRKSQFVGLCTIVPMARESEDLLASEQLHGLRMNKSHIARPKQASRVLYIGSIGADGVQAKAAVMSYVLGIIDDAANHGVKRVYTRPVTIDGLRVAKKYGFEPVKPDVGPDDLRRLYCLDLNQGRTARRSKQSQND